MLFTRDLTIPAGTLKAVPAQSELALIAGTIRRIEAVFPPGPATLVHVTVRDSLFQLMPANPDEDINQDEAVVRSDMDYKMQKPYTLIFEGWSPDALYPHTITFNVDLAPESQDDLKRLLQILSGGSAGVLQGR
jgi:hypothetical protein